LRAGLRGGKDQQKRMRCAKRVAFKPGDAPTLRARDGSGLAVHQILLWVRRAANTLRNGYLKRVNPEWIFGALHGSLIWVIELSCTTLSCAMM
jgi:hypothetical protein